MKRVLAAILLSCPFILLALVHKSAGRGLKPGELLPEGRLASNEGVCEQTASWRGTPTLLVLFQPACRACREEIRGLTAIAPELPGLRIILLTTNGELPDKSVPFPVYRDPSGEFVRRTRMLLVPALYWIDASGRVRYARSGLRHTSQELALFRSLLGEGIG